MFEFEDKDINYSQQMSRKFIQWGKEMLLMFHHIHNLKKKKKLQHNVGSKNQRSLDLNDFWYFFNFCLTYPVHENSPYRNKNIFICKVFSNCKCQKPYWTRKNLSIFWRAERSLIKSSQMFWVLTFIFMKSLMISKILGSL